MPIGDPRDGFFYPTLTLMIDSYIIGALLNFIWGLLFEKTYLIVIKDETDLKSKLNASTLILIGSYVRKLVASYLKKGR